MNAQIDIIKHHFTVLTEPAVMNATEIAEQEQF
jgi:hypothetical protein